MAKQTRGERAELHLLSIRVFAKEAGLSAHVMEYGYRDWVAALELYSDRVIASHSTSRAMAIDALHARLRDAAMALLSAGEGVE